MANLNAAASWDPVYQIEELDDVLGGTTPAQIANRQAQALVNRTLFLKDGVDAAAAELLAARGGLSNLAARLVAMDGAIAGKASAIHGHAIGDVVGLQGALDGKSATGHAHAIGDVVGLQGALDGKSATGHGHAIGEIGGLQGALDGKHARADQSHAGDWHVTGKASGEVAPEGDQDYVRLLELRGATANQYASLVHFAASIPDAWGTGPYPLTLQQKLASGADVIFDADPVYLKIQRSAVYDIAGHTVVAAGCGNRDSYLEIWLHPAGGGAAVLLYAVHEPDCSGTPATPFHRTVALGTGDRLRFVGNTKGGGSVWGTVRLCGLQAPTNPLTITTGDQAWMAASGQTYPKLVQFYLAASNPVGVVSWSVIGGTGQADASITDNVLTFSWAAAGAKTLDVHAVDSQGRSTTKTLTLTLQAFAVVALVITTGNYSDEAINGYPHPIAINLTSTGGELPITWSLVAGVDTTLPGAAVSGSSLTGSVTGAGTWTARVRATDSAGASQVVEKVLTVSVADYDPGPGDGGGGCFDLERAFVLMADGLGKPFGQVRAGEEHLSIRASHHEKGYRGVRKGVITDVIRHEGDFHLVELFGVPGTGNHPFAVALPCDSCGGKLPGGWKRLEDLSAADLVVKVEGEASSVVPAQEPTPAGLVQVVGNLGSSLHSFLVGPTPAGPWFLVHNLKILT